MKHLNFRALVPNYMSLVRVQWRQWRHCKHMIISEPVLFEPQVVFAFSAAGKKKKKKPTKPSTPSK